MSATVVLRSRDNPLLVSLRRHVRDGLAYRKQGLAWLEGDHLVRAALARGVRPTQVVLTESAANSDTLMQLARQANQYAVVADALFKDLSSLPSPVSMGGLVAVPAEAFPKAGLPTLVLDRVQDAGNVGSILRSASAMGVRQVLALKGSAGLWTPKVLRAAMGAHFGLHLCEGLTPASIQALALYLVATSSHDGVEVFNAALPDHTAFVFGHEGQGVSAELFDNCAQLVRIPQPGGEESLNVAAAAAICLYEWARQRFSK